MAPSALKGQVGAGAGGEQDHDFVIAAPVTPAPVRRMTLCKAERFGFAGAATTGAPGQRFHRNEDKRP
jgi:hypothetical protein